MIWYKDNNNDIAVSTRIRLARNLDGIPFPNALNDKTQASEKIKQAILGGNSTLARDFDFLNLDNVSAGDKQSLAEEHLISPQMLEGSGKSALISKDKTMSIMLMEEDHIRLQIIMGGLSLDEAYETANRVDDVIEENVAYAFDEEFGYLTACPTNAGTGMRASVMLHLPALTMTENISRVIRSAANMGIAVRGLYGEGTRAYGNLYQFSNQITMGLSEREILEKLKNIVNQIIEMEEKARKSLAQNSGDVLTDKVFRSFGTLKYARSMSSSEAKSLLSDVWLGRSMGIIPKDGKLSIIEIMVRISPPFIGMELPSTERDKKRAEFLRDNI